MTEFMDVTTDEQAPVHGKIRYRAVVIPQVPCEAFVVQVTTFEEAEIVCDILARFEMFLFEQKVMPDYSNAVFVEQWDAKYKEWEDVDEG